MCDLDYPNSYIKYLVHFHGDRDYFECHEELEELWKQDQRGERKQYWVGLIQIAVSLYHHRRNNFQGAIRMMQNAISIIQKEKKQIMSLGLNPEELLRLLKKRVKEIENHDPYYSFNLPIIDSELLSLCEQKCQLLGLNWGMESPLNNLQLIDKHKLRDRNDVIAEREKQKRIKKNKK